MQKITKLIIKLIILSILTIGIIFAQQPVAQGPKAPNSAAWDINIASLNTIALANATAYGTAPSGNVIGVNSFITNTVTVTFGASTSSSAALTSFDLAATAATQVKATSGNVYGWYVYNPNSTPCFLQFYNNAAATLGTGALHPVGVQAGQTAIISPDGLALYNFATAISTGQTTTATGSTPCTTAMTATILFQ